MNKVNLPLFLSLIIFLATTIIVGVFGVIPLPEYGNLTSNMEFDGKIMELTLNEKDAAASEDDPDTGPNLYILEGIVMNEPNLE